MMKKLLVRLQNKAVLVSTLSGVLVALQALGLLTLPQVDHINVVANGLFAVLIALGVIADPESHVKEGE